MNNTVSQLEQLQGRNKKLSGMQKISEDTERNLQTQVDTLKTGNEELLTVIKQLQNQLKDRQNQAFDSKLDAEKEDKATQTRMKMSKMKLRPRYERNESILNLTKSSGKQVDIRKLTLKPQSSSLHNIQVNLNKGASK